MNWLGSRLSRRVTWPANLKFQAYSVFTNKSLKEEEFSLCVEGNTLRHTTQKAIGLMIVAHQIDFYFISILFMYICIFSEEIVLTSVKSLSTLVSHFK